MVRDPPQTAAFFSPQSIPRPSHKFRPTVWSTPLRIFPRSPTRTRRLMSQGIRSGWLHSALDATERAAVLAKLQGGELEILVGVNLLREGLDLPEVSLVAVLGADKEVRRTRPWLRRRTAPALMRPLFRCMPVITQKRELSQWVRSFVTPVTLFSSHCRVSFAAPAPSSSSWGALRATSTELPCCMAIG